MASYDIYGNRRGDIWEPEQKRELRERREYEAEQLRELNERIRRTERELQQVRRLADGIDDGGPDDDGAGYDEQKDTHGIANTLGHAHGRFAKHQHFHDNDHSDAPPAPGGAVAGWMSEPRRRAKTLAEQLLAQGIMTASEAAPIISQYQRKPNSIQDEGDVRADEGDDGSQDETATDNASGFDLEKNTHGPMTGMHKHGIYAEHVHARDNNHGQALLKAAGALGKNY